MIGVIILYGTLALAILDNALKIYQLAADRTARRRLDLAHQLALVYALAAAPHDSAGAGVAAVKRAKRSITS